MGQWAITVRWWLKSIWPPEKSFFIFEKRPRLTARVRKNFRAPSKIRHFFILGCLRVENSWKWKKTFGARKKCFLNCACRGSIPLLASSQTLHPLRMEFFGISGLRAQEAFGPFRFVQWQRPMNANEPGGSLRFVSLRFVRFRFERKASPNPWHTTLLLHDFFGDLHFHESTWQSSDVFG